jgi:hypothetical protein
MGIHHGRTLALETVILTEARSVQILIQYSVIMTHFEVFGIQYSGNKVAVQDAFDYEKREVKFGER